MRSCRIRTRSVLPTSLTTKHAIRWRWEWSRSGQRRSMSRDSDPLLERIKQITDRANRVQYDREKRHAASAIGTVEREAVSFHKFFYQFSQVIGWSLRTLVVPLWRPLYRSV